MFVEIEGQRIEFLASRVGLERSKLVPPMFASIFPDLTILLMQCAVQENC